MKKILVIVAVILFAATLIAGVFFMLRKDEDSWICQNGVWIKHGNPAASMPTEPCSSAMDGMNDLETKEGNQKRIGGETDEHGCLTGAGYSWCEPKHKCLRTWEELCTPN